MSKRTHFCLPCVIAMLILSLVLSGCGGSSSTSGNLSITAVSTTIPVGSTTQLHALNTNFLKQTVDATTSVTWSTSDRNIATVDAKGVLTGVSVGSVVVSATLSKDKGTASFTITAPAITALSLSPDGATVPAGGIQQYAANGTYSNGITADASGSVQWTVSPSSVATISRSGLLTAVSNGSFQVTATSGSVSASVSGTVTGTPVTLSQLIVQPTSASIAAGTADRYSATAIYSDGSQRDVTNDATWSVSDQATASASARGVRFQSARSSDARLHANDTASTSSIASVDATGVYTGLAVGRTMVQASFGGSQSQSDLLVTDATPVSVTVTSNRGLFPSGATQKLMLVGTFSDGSMQDLSRSATWKSSNASIATIDATGLVTGVGSGTVQLTGTFSGQSDSLSLQVLPKSLQSMVINANYSTLATGDSEALQVIGLYSDGTTHDVTSLATWQTQDSSILEFSGNAALHAKKAGTSQITATVNGIASSRNFSAVDAAVTGMQIIPGAPTIATETNSAFTLLASFAGGGSIDVTDQAVWSSSDPTVLTINSSGLAKAGNPGTARVTATYLGGSVSTQDVQVTSATVSRLQIFGPAARIAAGSSQRYTALAILSDGTFQDVTSSVVWDSSDQTTMIADATGLSRGIKAGTAQMLASLQGMTASSPLTVTDATVVSVDIVPGNSELPMGVIKQFSLMANMSDGSRQDITKGAIWGSSGTGVIAEYLLGRVIGLTVGTGSVQAQYGFFSASTPVNVTNATLQSMVLAPADTRLRKGERQQMVATGTFSDGYTQNLSLNIVYNSTDARVASVLGRDGFANAIHPGSTQITVTGLGQIATTNSFRVTSDVLSTLTLSPSSPAIPSGGTLQLTATGTFEDGEQYDLSNSVAWSSSNPAIVAVDANGMATAATVTAAATATVTAALGTTTQSFLITVNPPGTGGGGGGNDGGNGGTPPTLTGIAVVPTSTHMAAGTGVQIQALGLYSNGTRQDLSAGATWATDNTAIATVNASGVVSGVAPGLATVTVSAGGFSGTAVVNVSAATLVSLAIDPAVSNFAVGAPEPFTLVGTFSDGSKQDLNAVTTWSSSDTGVATIDSKGTATGVAPGSVQLSATFHGQTTTTGTVSVTPATLTALAVTPSTFTLAKGTSKELSAIAIYSDGTTKNVSSKAIFTSSDPSVIVIDANGVATGVGTGSAGVTVGFGDQTAATQSITVTPATLTALNVTPLTPQFANGTTQQFTVAGTFTDGTTQDLSTQAIWSSSDPSVLTIDGNGLASSWAVGQAQVRASFNGMVASTSSVQVTPSTLRSLAITPVNVNLPNGSTQQFTAMGTFSDGTVQNVSHSVAWSTGTPGVVTVDPDGLATAHAIGQTTVLASYQERTSMPAVVQVTAATPTGLFLDPASMNLLPGGTQQLTATFSLTDGTTVRTDSVTYQSLNTNVATVSNSGLVTAVSAGTTTITVTGNGFSAASNVNVTASAPSLASISITPVVVHLGIGGTQQIQVSGTYSDGSAVNLNGSGITISYSSSNVNVASVDLSGVVTAHTSGTAQIAVAVGGFTGTSTVMVDSSNLASIGVTPATVTLANGTAQQYRAMERLNDGSTRDITNTVSWVSTDPSVATVSATGLAATHRIGETNIRAVSGAVSGTGTMTVTGATAVNVQISPSSLALPSGGVSKLIATASFSDGSSQDVTASVQYSTSNPNVATVDADGTVHGVGQGTATILARLGDASATSTVSTTSAVLTGIAITPADVTLALGMSQPFTATGTYSDGSTEDLTAAVRWTSSDPTVAVVDASGMVTIVGTVQGPTTVTITAVSGSFSSTPLSINVSPTLAATAIAVSPATAMLVAGQTQQFAATATMNDGTQQDVTYSVHWSVSSPGLATVSNTGLLTVNGTGAFTVSATMGGISGNGDVTVLPVALSSISITPNPVRLSSGTAVKLLVTGNYADGSSADLTNASTFSSATESVATVGADGTVHGTGIGTTTVTVRAQGATETVPVTTTPAMLSSIAIAPEAPSVPVGLTVQLTATGIYGNGSVVDLSSQVQWSSSAPGVATVSNTGLVTSLSQGTATITGTLNGVSQSVTVAATAATLQSITVGAASTSFALGYSIQLRAIGNYSDGSTQDLTNSVTWQSETPDVGLVSSTGMATGRNTGSFTAKATKGNVSGDLTLTVSAAVLRAITVTPADSLILNVLGPRVQFTATGTYSDGSTRNITSSVHWSLTSPVSVLATINDEGQFSPLGIGIGSVVAISGEITGSTGYTIVSVL